MQDNNQTAPLQDNASETVKPEVIESPKVSEVAKGDASSNTTSKPEESSQAFDARATYDGLKSEFERVNKSYSELRKEFTRRTQAEAELQRKMDNLVETFSKATEKPIDPQQFIRDLQTQGPKALEPYFQNWSKPMRDQYDKAMVEKDNYIFEIQRDFEIERRRRDTTNHPDFEKLEPTMKEIAESENCPVDFGQAPGAILDALYKLAKDHNADQAIKIAEKNGYEKATKELAKEANTAIAGGGKTAGTSVPDWGKMSSDKMREVVAQLHGVADRD